MKLPPQLLVSVGAASLVLSSWLLGGLWPEFVYVATAIAVVSLVLVATDRWRQRLTLPVRVALAMLLGWAGYVVLSVFNPSHELISIDGRQFWRKIPHLAEFPSTADPERTLVFFAWILAAIGVALLVGMTNLSRTWLRRLLMAAVVNGLILTLVGFYFRLDGTGLVLGWIEVPWWQQSFFGTLLYRNHWGAFAMLHMFAAIGLFWYTRREAHTGEDLSLERQVGWFWCFAAVLFALSIFFVGSRSTMLAMGAAGGLLFLLAPRKKSRHRLGWWIGVAQRVGLLAAVGVGIFALNYLINPKAVASALGRTQSDVAVLAGDEQSIRFLPFINTWRMIVDEPVFGIGLGSYKHINIAYAGPEYLILGPDGVFLRGLEFAHVDWLQYASELGAMGMVLLLVPAGIAFWQLRRGRSNPISSCLLAGTGGILIMAAFELPLSNPCITIHTLLFAAVGVRYAIAQQTAHEELEQVRARHYRHEVHKPRHLSPALAQPKPSLN